MLLCFVVIQWWYDFMGINVIYISIFLSVALLAFGQSLDDNSAGEVIMKSMLGNDLNYKSHNAPVPYPTMQHSEQKCAHFCSECCIVGYRTGALWDLWDWSVVQDDTTSKHIKTQYRAHISWIYGSLFGGFKMDWVECICINSWTDEFLNK